MPQKDQNKTERYTVLRIRSDRERKKGLNLLMAIFWALAFLVLLIWVSWR